MSQSLHAVIGAHYGDEGKGRLTDALTTQTDPAATLVIRANGGAQAGHTVETDTGIRHVFSHVGSGALAGAATWLGPRFAAHPPLLLAELARLKTLGITPSLAIDPRAPVTTPYDILINQAIEQARGPARHGSCGIGFGETIGRDQHPAFRLTIADLTQPLTLRTRLEAIRQDWAPTRLTELGIRTLPETLSRILWSEPAIQPWLDAAEAFLDHVRLAGPEILIRPETLIFEGAQGLLLDEVFGGFPHVTRSRTGLGQILPLLQEAGLEQAPLQIHYVSRCYLTRHGAGPLSGEWPSPLPESLSDPTNASNPWQGSLRFADLDPALSRRVIARDLAEGADFTLRPDLTVTCLDQLPDGAARARALAETLDLPLVAEGWGRARSALLRPERQRPATRSASANRASASAVQA